MRRDRTLNLGAIKLILIAVAALTTIIGAGCGKPGVKLSAVSGEARDIPVWRVVWADSADTMRQTIDDTVLAKTRSRYNTPRYAREFVDRVASELEWRRHLPILQTSTTGGLIAIKLQGQRVLSMTYPSSLYEDKARTLAETADVEGLKRGETVTPDSDNANLGPADFVGFVDVAIYGVDNRQLTRILIGRNDDHKIKPEFVAEVIAKALAKGSY